MQPEVRQAVLGYLHRCPPGRLLDFPAGTGWLCAALGDARWEYHGADLYTRPASPRFRMADLQEPFPYGDCVFDYVVCLEGLEHVENYHHVLREARRVLRPGGVLLLSTPNPLNIKSRIRYFWRGTFHGFPHLADMPAEGEHVHLTPINLSFLLAFADKYGLELETIHGMPIRPAMYRFLPCALAIRAYTQVRSVWQPPKMRAWMRRLASWSLLLNDGLVVSFIRRIAEANVKPGSLAHAARSA